MAIFVFIIFSKFLKFLHSIFACFRNDAKFSQKFLVDFLLRVYPALHFWLLYIARQEEREHH